MSSNKPLALVSGANRGIGLAIATGLAREGAGVLLGCRDMERGEAASAPLRAEGLQVRPVQLDTTDDASVAALAALIEKDYGALDILVNNAGIGIDYDPSLSVLDCLQRTLDVNVIGTVRMTEAMIPLLAKSQQARIVNVSSELASFGLRFDPEWPYHETKMPTYQASKAAVNSLTVSYADKLQAQGIAVNAMCPGYTATEATNYAGTRTPEEAARIAIKLALHTEQSVTASFSNEAGILPW